MFLLVPAHLDSPGQRAIKRLLLLLFPDESGLASFPAVLFLTVIQKRTFEDKWHRFFVGQMPFLSPGQEGT